MYHFSLEQFEKNNITPGSRLTIRTGFNSITAWISFTSFGNAIVFFLIGYLCCYLLIQIKSVGNMFRHASVPKRTKEAKINFYFNLYTPNPFHVFIYICHNGSVTIPPFFSKLCQLNTIYILHGIIFILFTSIFLLLLLLLLALRMIICKFSNFKETYQEPFVCKTSSLQQNKSNYTPEVKVRCSITSHSKAPRKLKFHPIRNKNEEEEWKRANQMPQAERTTRLRIDEKTVKL